MNLKALDGHSKTNRAIDSVVELMPGGKNHWRNREIPFDYARSEVVQWMLGMAEDELVEKFHGPHGPVWEGMVHWLFTAVSRRDVIRFDAEKDAWKGAGRGYTEERLQEMGRSKAAALLELRKAGRARGNQYEARFTADAALECLQKPYFHEGKWDESATTATMTEELEFHLGCSSATAFRLLRRLREEGKIPGMRAPVPEKPKSKTPTPAHQEEPVTL
jgi:hypothetical protein